MKKYFAFNLFFLSCAVSVFAQISITQADMPQPNDTIRLSTTIDTIGLPPFALTGANYTWDYSHLAPMSQTIDTFLSVGSTPLAYQLYFNDSFLYPAYLSTIAQAAPNPPTIPPVAIKQVINYYKATSSAYENVGFGANIDAVPTSVKDDSIDFIYRFPLNYGNADSCNSAYHLTIPFLGYYGTMQHRVNYADGWGTLKTPYGTFQTLRVVTKIFATDTLYMDTLHFGFASPLPEQLQYKWLASGEKLPVLQINENVVGSAPVLTSITYRDSARQIALGTPQINAAMNEIKVFPNPAINTIFITAGNSSAPSVMQAYLYNSIGKLVMQKHLKEYGKGNTYSIRINSLPQGTYFLKLLNNMKEQTFKIVKVN